jgi:hypothetical protein
MATWEQHMSKLAHNERVKLFATFLNNAGVAAWVGGFIIPLIQGKSLSFFNVTTISGIVIGLVLHIAGFLFLGKLKE